MPSTDGQEEFVANLNERLTIYSFVNVRSSKQSVLQPHALARTSNISRLWALDAEHYNQCHTGAKRLNVDNCRTLID